MFRRTQIQITLWAAAVLLGTVLISELLGYVWIARTLDAQIDADISATVDAVVADLGPLRLAPTVDRGTDPVAEEGGVFVLVYDDNGELLANPSDVRLPAAPFGEFVRRALVGRRDWHTVAAEDERLRILAEPVVESGRVAGAVIAGRSLELRDDRLWLVRRLLGGGALLGLGAALAVGHLVAGRSIRPLRLAYERQEAFVADASHELRSPLAVIQTAADLLLRRDLSSDERELVQEIHGVSTEANVVLDELLELARLTTPASNQAPQTSLSAVAGDELARLRPWLEEAGVTCATDLPPATVLASEREVRRLVRALLENVVRHTPRGTTAFLECRNDPRTAILAVEDDGPGVPTTDLPKIFERFAQVDEARTPEAGSHAPGTGAGLGLAIVRAIAERRGGSVVARQGARGGLRVEVTLPSTAVPTVVTTPGVDDGTM
ncbi:MAG: HAMP domain-containing sensor histidine kinase [Chloroflexi bacterium]|nr:HAMP domain-containing sensor histidine kinase [Chloroflexota bacterium]MDA1145253.1 HAMP domain-containing sensor histidine kinase [Chloroflexota bacterium]